MDPSILLPSPAKEGVGGGGAGVNLAECWMLRTDHIEAFMAAATNCVACRGSAEWCVQPGTHDSPDSIPPASILAIILECFGLCARAEHNSGSMSHGDTLAPSAVRGTNLAATAADGTHIQSSEADPFFASSDGVVGRGAAKDADIDLVVSDRAVWMRFDGGVHAEQYLFAGG